MYARPLLYIRLTSEIIEADVCIVDAQRVEQVEDGLSHHRWTAEAERRPAYREERPPPRRAYSIMLLEVGVASISRARSRSLPRHLRHARSRHPRASQRASLRPPRAHPAPQRLSLTRNLTISSWSLN